MLSLSSISVLVMFLLCVWCLVFLPLVRVVVSCILLSLGGGLWWGGVRPQDFPPQQPSDNRSTWTTRPRKISRTRTNKRRMPGSKKGKPKKLQPVIELTIPEANEDYFPFVAAIASQRTRFKVSSIDSRGVVERFAAENGLKFNDVTTLVTCEHNADVGKTLMFVQVVARTAIKRPDTVYYFGSDASNLEASGFLSVHAQIQLRNPTVSPDDFLSCWVWNSDNFFVSFDSCEPKLKNGLMSMAPNWECAICLGSIDEVNGARSQWECFHCVCVSCAKDIVLGSPCPLCREKMVTPRRFQFFEQT